MGHIVTLDPLWTYHLEALQAMVQPESRHALTREIQVEKCTNVPSATRSGDSHTARCVQEEPGIEPNHKRTQKLCRAPSDKTGRRKHQAMDEGVVTRVDSEVEV